MSRSGADGLHVPEKEATVSNILQIIRLAANCQLYLQKQNKKNSVCLTFLSWLVRSCNRSYESEESDETSTSPSSTGPSLTLRCNSLRDRCHNQLVVSPDFFHKIKCFFYQSLFLTLLYARFNWMLLFCLGIH